MEGEERKGEEILSFVSPAARRNVVVGRCFGYKVRLKRVEKGRGAGRGGAVRVIPVWSGADWWFGWMMVVRWIDGCGRVQWRSGEGWLERTNDAR